MDADYARSIGARARKIRRRRGLSLEVVAGMALPSIRVALNGGGDLDVVVTHVASRSRIFAEVALTVAGENRARLKIDVWCCLDSYQQYLAVEESTYQLIAQVDRGPIMRFEYERGATSKPRAHVQVHAHRGALSHLLSQARHPTPHSMESLHLPVGGDRFRPCSKTSSSSSWSSAVRISG